MTGLTDGVVTLTRPRLEDAEAIAATVQASLDTIMPWMFWATPDSGWPSDSQARPRRRFVNGCTSAAVGTTRSCTGFLRAKRAVRAAGS